MSSISHKNRAEQLDKFKATWEKCRLCEIANHKFKIALYRGEIPTDVLFIGEAPGEAEDSFGEPFVGPSGRLLSQIVDDAKEFILHQGFGKQVADFTCCYTNLIACAPKDLVGIGYMFRQPSVTEISNCSSRLDDFLALANPKIIFCVGKIAESNFKARHVPTFPIVHPAAILRQNKESQAELMMKKAETRIAKSVMDTLSPSKKR